MADTLFFAAMLFYGWSVGSGLDRSGNVTMAANSPEGSRPLPASRVGAAHVRPATLRQKQFYRKAAGRACPAPTNIVILFRISSVPSLQRRNKPPLRIRIQLQHRGKRLARQGHAAQLAHLLFAFLLLFQ